MEEVQSQAWSGNATHEAEESTSGSKFEVSWSFLHTPSVDQEDLILCDPPVFSGYLGRLMFLSSPSRDWGTSQVFS